MASLAITTPWFALVLFLIFLGGVIVLFIYIASLASNENFLWDQTKIILTLTLGRFIALVGRLYPHPEWTCLDNKLYQFIASILSVKFINLYGLLILYLLGALLIVSSLIKKFKAPLRAVI